MPTRRPGGRAAAVVAAVHAAAADLLGDVGYHAFELTDVAERAGVHKSTVYRRWPTKSALVSELLLTLTDHDDPVNDTGSLFGDLVAMLQDISDLLHTPVATALLRASATGDIDPATREAFWTERFRRSSVIVARAIDRGEVPEGTDARLLLEHASSPIYFRVLATGDAIDQHDLHVFARRAIAALDR